MIDTATIEFAVAVAEGVLALTAAGLGLKYWHRAERYFDHAAYWRARAKEGEEAFDNECVESEHQRKLVADAQGELQATKDMMEMLADSLSKVGSELNRMHFEQYTATERRRAHMRVIGIRGNKSPKRRVSRAKAA